MPRPLFTVSDGSGFHPGLQVGRAAPASDPPHCESRGPSPWGLDAGGRPFTARGCMVVLYRRGAVFQFSDRGRGGHAPSSWRLERCRVWLHEGQGKNQPWQLQDAVCTPRAVTVPSSHIYRLRNAGAVRGVRETAVSEWSRPCPGSSVPRAGAGQQTGGHPCQEGRGREGSGQHVDGRAWRGCSGWRGFHTHGGGRQLC